MGAKEEYFSNISNRERAIFEGAISMGALFHQFVGTPFNKTNIASLEKAMEESFTLQPCIEKVEVSIDLDRLDNAMTEFEYTSLSGDMLDVKIYSKVVDVLAVIRIKFIEELNYPLMFVEEIIE
ncbi:MAG: dihydroneopterin aldolase [Methanobrevibacter olleyae]|uniref:Dihydroneopterin aldolase n=1 Tax=Methanobrevibacter olleyae TaxID=294671 RepID=A0A8T3VMT0_METOL|nr:dihydroneopterin aldolase [Methanobrevibacter olleyae]